MQRMSRRSAMCSGSGGAFGFRPGFQLRPPALGHRCPAGMQPADGLGTAEKDTMQPASTAAARCNPLAPARTAVLPPRWHCHPRTAADNRGGPPHVRSPTATLLEANRLPQPPPKLQLLEQPAPKTPPSVTNQTDIGEATLEVRNPARYSAHGRTCGLRVSTLGILPYLPAMCAFSFPEIRAYPGIKANQPDRRSFSNHQTPD